MGPAGPQGAVAPAGHGPAASHAVDADAAFPQGCSEGSVMCAPDATALGLGPDPQPEQGASVGVGPSPEFTSAAGTATRLG